MVPISIRAQGFSVVLPENLSQTGVTITPYEPNVSSVFDSFAETNSGYNRLLPYSAILTNLSDIAITGLTLRWIWVSPGSDSEKTHTIRQDSYYFVAIPVASPGSRLLLTPARSWLENSLSIPNIPITHNIAAIRFADHFASRSVLRLEVDVVIFESGLVIGSDLSETIEGIRARKLAAETIVQITREKLKDGIEINSLLSPFASDQTGYRSKIDRWQRSISRMLVGDDPRYQIALIDQLNNLPDLSHLYTVQ